ncbi:hypothetical protein KQI49_18175 [Virgibacillus sp. MSJ-26]|uniref:hypothetical protein n=1 Tax=Virgibacillus sp. MSJ-26 TaxID=2841522 RepID=UPI001C123887|nr:hypothetical protein [Virgibacillus sp. MSJ-26]MBU5468723.1 hypothetical protein [Virgibacillus sp. MSJ-26]
MIDQMNRWRDNKFAMASFLLVTIIVLFYSLSIKQNLLMKADSIYQLNFWDIALSLLSDPYLFIYLFLPIWLFLCVYYIEKSFEFSFIIRLGSFNGWIFQVAKSMKKYFFMYLLIFAGTLMLIFMTSTYTLDNEWSIYSYTSDINNIGILSSLIQTGLSPILSLIFQLFYITLFLCTIFLLLCALYIYTQKKIVLIIVSCLVFLYSAASFQFLPENFSFLSVANYAFLYHAYASFDSIILAPIIMLLSLVLILSLNTLIRMKTINKSNLFSLTPYLIYIALIFVGLFTNILEYDGIGKTMGDFMYLKFYGVDIEDFAVLQHVYYSIVFLGFCYLFQMHLDAILTDRLYYELIRYKSYYKWFKIFMKNVILSIILLLVFLLCLIIIIGYLKGYQFSFENLLIDVPSSYYVTLYHFFVNSLLQMLNYILIVFIVSWLFNESYYGLVALGLFMVLMLPFVNTAHLLPFGLNSFGLLANLNVFKITLYLFIGLLVEGIIIFTLFKKKLSI